MLHGTTRNNKFPRNKRCARFLMLVQKLATFCHNKKSLKVVMRAMLHGPTRDNFPPNVCCAKTCCCELSRVTSPLDLAIAASFVWFKGLLASFVFSEGVYFGLASK